MSTHISTEALDRAAATIASARERLQALAKLNAALGMKRTESDQVGQEIRRALDALENAEAAAAIDPEHSSESAKTDLRNAREQKEFVDAAIAGLTRQRSDILKTLKELSAGLQITRNIRAQVRLEELQAGMMAAVETIRQVLSRAKGVSIALGQDRARDAHLGSFVGSENLLSSTYTDPKVVNEEELEHSDLRDLLRHVESACRE